jgi:hypothetical protein
MTHKPGTWEMLKIVPKTGKRLGVPTAMTAKWQIVKGIKFSNPKPCNRVRPVSLSDPLKG